MKKFTSILCLAFTILVGSMGISTSADFQKGLDAYRNGDFASALREWRPLAEKGDVAAEGKMGHAKAASP